MRWNRWCAQVVVAGLMAGGVAGIAAATPASAASCTAVLTTNVEYMGTDSNDVVCIAGDGAYTVDTAGGDDSVRVTGAASSVDVALGNGNDTYSGALAKTSAVDGGTGNDRITTGEGADVVIGGSGDDVIATKAGDDTVEAGDGNDRIVTDDGDDAVDAGDGNDRVSTKNGADVIAGGPGLDNLNGGAGDDSISGGPDADKINGLDGADDLTGDDGADRISAGAGDDTLDGGNGDDVLVGANGTDSLAGGGGADALSGGNGDDGFSASAFDLVQTGTGDAACDDPSTITVSCVAGAVVTAVSGDAEAVGQGFLVTVRAHVIDFSGVGATRVAIAERYDDSPAWNSDITGDPATGAYRSTVPELVSGTVANGEYVATFALPSAPLTGRMSMRIFTTGFSVDAWSYCWTGPCALMSKGTCGASGCKPTEPATWHCVSGFAYSDTECGNYSAVVAGVTGFPKSMQPIVFDGAPPAPATLLSYGADRVSVVAGNDTLINAAGTVWVPTNSPALDTTFILGDWWWNRNLGGGAGGSTFDYVFPTPLCASASGGSATWLPQGNATFRLRAFAVTVPIPNGDADGFYVWSPDRAGVSTRCT